MNILNRQWNTIITEYFDIFDTKTRKILLSLNEADDRNMVLSSLSARLYNIIVDKSTEIDYGDIPRSKGDITRIPNFVNIIDCLNTIRGLLVEFKEDTAPIDEILKAIDNLKDSRDLWEKAYVYNSSVPIVFYETMALAIVSSTSLLISTSIDYIKEPAEKDFSITLDKVAYHKNKNGLLFRNLKKFNNAYKNEDIKKVFEPMLKVRENLKESVDIINEFSASAIIAAAITAGVMVSLIGLVIPILHESVVFFYCAKQSISEYFDMQADLLALNAERVKLDVTKTESEREKIYQRQMKIVSRFKKGANALAVKLKSAEKRGEAMYKKEASTKYKVDELMDDSFIASKSNSSMF